MVSLIKQTIRPGPWPVSWRTRAQGGDSCLFGRQIASRPPLARARRATPASADPDTILGGDVRNRVWGGFKGWTPRQATSNLCLPNGPLHLGASGVYGTGNLIVHRKGVSRQSGRFKGAAALPRIAGLGAACHSLGHRMRFAPE